MKMARRLGLSAVLFHRTWRWAASYPMGAVVTIPIRGLW